MSKLCDDLGDDVIVCDCTVDKEQDAEGLRPNLLGHVRERWAVHDALNGEWPGVSVKLSYRKRSTVHIQELAHKL